MIDARTSNNHSKQSGPPGENVEFAEFVWLMISREEIIRLDEPESGLLGLLNVRTGKRFIIKEEAFNKRLMMPQATQ
jgi:hypothetical protein